MILSGVETKKLIKDLKEIERLAKEVSGWGDSMFSGDCDKIEKLAKENLKILCKK